MRRAFRSEAEILTLLLGVLLYGLAVTCTAPAPGPLRGDPVWSDGHE
jgi:hypothetical protein